MNSDFLSLLQKIGADRGVQVDLVIQTIEDALLAAYRRGYGHLGHHDARVQINRATGEIAVLARRHVVAEVLDPEHEVSLGAAMRQSPDATLNADVEVPVTPPDFTRVAAQVVRTTLRDRLRPLEGDALYQQLLGRQNELVAAQVLSVLRDFVVMSVDGAVAVLPVAEQVPSDGYHPGQRLRVYVLQVNRRPRVHVPPLRIDRADGRRAVLDEAGPQLIVSRSDRNLLRRLFELEIPEVFAGTVEIKAIAREAGSRSKVAVTTRQEGVDPVGSCVGMKGTRNKSIVAELSGEKVDVVPWSHDPATFVANALSPAQVLDVEIQELEHTAIVTVPDRQLSLAIGKEGQNARLSAKLTGWRIDIKAASARGIPEGDGPEPMVDARSTSEALV